MNRYVKEIVQKATGAADCYEIETVQELWSGYGEIVRIGLKEADRQSVIVKHVSFPEQDRHPRGWNTGNSHQRKIHSYRVESAWYSKWSSMCGNECPVPVCLALETIGEEVVMVLEDLDAGGYPGRRSSVTWNEMQACISWLAHFHAVFLGEQPAGLWKTGTYWHLDTRPDELAALNDLPLKEAAPEIDTVLRQSPFQTFVHGDAKLANFCFSPEGGKVAAVDFQYVGGGCGMKDLAYFVGSCLYEEECERMESQVLDYYFECLGHGLHAQNKDADLESLEQDWRALYPYAWTDFHRFIKGWSPGHWKINSYSEHLARNVIAELNK